MIRNNIKGYSPIIWLMLIWPFVSFVYAIANFSNKNYRIILILFITFYGLTMVTDAAGDSSRHAAKFSNYLLITFDDYFSSVINIITRQSKFQTDIYLLTTNFFVAQFTDKFKFVFALHALIFAFFYVGSLSILRDEYAKLNMNALFFIIFLALTYSLSKIGFVRYPIATWVFFYGALGYIYKTRVLFLIIMCSSLLIHFSYIFAILPFFFLLSFGRKRVLYMSILLISLLTPNLLFSRLSSFDSSDVEVGVALERRISGYSNVEYKQEREESFAKSAWYKKYRLTFFNYYLIFLIGLIFFYFSRSYHDRIQEYLYCFILLMAAFVNWGLAFESLGQRFTFILSFFVFAYMYRYFMLNKVKRVHWVTFIGFIPFALYVAFDLRQLAQYWNVLLFIGNPVSFILDDSFYSILKFIK